LGKPLDRFEKYEVLNLTRLGDGRDMDRGGDVKDRDY
jgi:hypothetical protein